MEGNQRDSRYTKQPTISKEIPNNSQADVPYGRYSRCFQHSPSGW